MVHVIIKFYLYIILANPANFVLPEVLLLAKYTVNREFCQLQNCPWRTYNYNPNPDENYPDGHL